MNPATILLMINGLLDLIAKLFPALRAYQISGEISAEDQQKLLARVELMKANLSSLFSAPHWQPKDEPN